MTNYDREKIVVSKQWLVVREKDDNVRGNCHAGLVSASVVDDGVKDAVVTLEARSADRVHYFLHGSYRLRLQDDSFEDNDGCEALRLRMAGYISLQSPHKKGNPPLQRGTSCVSNFCCTLSCRGQPLSVTWLRSGSRLCASL